MHMQLLQEPRLGRDNVALRFLRRKRLVYCVRPHIMAKDGAALILQVDVVSANPAYV